MIWVPLRHLLHVLGIGVGRVVLGVVILRIGVMVHRRMRLRRYMMIVLGLMLVLLPSSLVHRARWRPVMAGHHGR
jgi:sulfite exporter TauE/SafE